MTFMDDLTTMVQEMVNTLCKDIPHRSDLVAGDRIYVTHRWPDGRYSLGVQDTEKFDLLATIPDEIRIKDKFEEHARFIDHIGMLMIQAIEVRKMTREFYQSIKDGTILDECE